MIMKLDLLLRLWQLGLALAFTKCKPCHSFSLPQFPFSPASGSDHAGIDIDSASSYESMRRQVLLRFPLPWLLLAGPFNAMASVIPASRQVDVGGGIDLLANTRLADNDVIYPVSMEGEWTWNRLVTLVEGDNFQAESAWRALGGNNLRVNEKETYSTRFVQSSLLGEMTGVVLDRGYETSSRTHNPSVLWEVTKPNNLQYGNIRVSVVKRKVEPPSDQGFGFDELYRVDDGLVTRAIQVKRRYRRNFDPDGNRVVEGLEIMKTFRVLDGVAGTEMPTSTTKSQLMLTRPSV